MAKTRLKLRRRLSLSDDEERRRLEVRAARRRYRNDLAANYRSYLAGIVSEATPILLDLCGHWSIDLAALVAGIRPPVRWPYDPPAGIRYAPALDGGAVERRRRLRIVASGAALEVRARMEGCFLTTSAGRLHLWLTDNVPETVAHGAPGRRLGDVVSHPVFDERSYTIVSCTLVGSSTLIEALAPPVPYRMPWA